MYGLWKAKKKPFQASDGTRFLLSLSGIEFDGDQSLVLSLLQDHPIVLVDGGPGSGKTTLGKEMGLRAVNAGLLIHGMAFLGKAAARLRAHSGIPASTIHRVRVIKGGRWEDMKGDPVKPPDIVVIDEAAMISNWLFFEALKLCPLHSRLLIIGDGGQLEPIDAGAPFLQLKKSGVLPMVHLRGQHRSGHGIVQACEAINRGEFPADNEHFRFIEKEAYPHDDDEVVQDDEKYALLTKALEGKDINETQIVTTSNNERHAVNRRYRKTQGYGIDEVYLGERVCGNRNDDNTGARNGEIGIVVQVNEGNRFDVQFANNPKRPDYKWPPVSTKKNDRRHGPHPDLDWAACITGNKSQGSEWDHVIVHLTGFSLMGRPWATRKWLYTVVSRERKTVEIHGDRRLVGAILNNGADCFRITRLDEVLRERFGTKGPR